MKKIQNGFFILLILAAFVSCEDFMDSHKEYIKDGEIIYAPKIGAAAFIAGKNRIEFLYMLYKSPNVRSVDLYWNDGADSLIIPVSPSAGIDMFSTVITDLDEKSYTFNARTTDLYGHKSLYLTDFGSSYGEIYQSTLSGRRINTVELIDKDDRGTGRIALYAAAEGLVRTELRYLKNDGATALIFAQDVDTMFLCPDVLPGSEFETRSLYIPETQAIDTFATEWISHATAFAMTYQYDRSEWEMVAVSDSAANQRGENILDGNLGTFWGSQAGVPVPHWIIIDMQSPRNIVKLDVYRRSGNTATRTVECYLGDSPVESDPWTLIGAGTFVSGYLMEIVSTDKTTRGRYLKIRLPDSNQAPYTFLAEIFPYGGR